MTHNKKEVEMFLLRWLKAVCVQKYYMTLFVASGATGKRRDRMYRKAFRWERMAGLFGDRSV